MMFGWPPPVSTDDLLPRWTFEALEQMRREIAGLPDQFAAFGEAPRLTQLLQSIEIGAGDDWL